MHPRPRIQIGISCLNIPGEHVGTYAKYSVAHGGTLHEKHVTETEVIFNDKQPVFTTRLTLEYFFEEKQIITVEIFNCTTEDKEDSTLLGFNQCTVGRVIHGGGQLELSLHTSDDKPDSEQNSISRTKVIVCIREDPFSKENIYLKVRGYNLDKKDFFGKSDPYITIYRRNERGKLQKTYRSEVIKNTLFPDFRPMLVCLDRLCGGNIESELCFRCYDWDGAHGDSEEVDTELDDLIGEFTTTAEELLNNGEDGIDFKLVNPSKKKRKKYYQNSGQLHITLSLVQTRYSFLDYIFGGTSLNVVVGVDLSKHVSTNEQLPTSRQIERAQLCHEYGVAIQAVMEILQEYDSDQLFPAFGFGSRLSSGGRVSQKYPLSGEENNYFCKGISGVLEAYRKSFEAIHLSGPVCFAPLIKDVTETAKQNRAAENYFVLLILTNGTVDDWTETKRAVIETSFLPISIIVIGVGGGNFADMETLDQDFGLLKVGQEKACRDNVQFVEMRRFLRLAADGTDNLRWSKVGLAKEVLAELPSQITDYFEKNQLSPCHTVPGQPTSLKDICNPNWWRTFTQPTQILKSPEDCIPSTSDRLSGDHPETKPSNLVKLNRNPSNPTSSTTTTQSTHERMKPMSASVRSRRKDADPNAWKIEPLPERDTPKDSTVKGSVAEGDLSYSRIQRQWSLEPSMYGARSSNRKL